jgi:hypothetical protein
MLRSFTLCNRLCCALYLPGKGLNLSHVFAPESFWQEGEHDQAESGTFAQV